MTISLSLHVIGLALWLPGLLVATGLLRKWASLGEAERDVTLLQFAGRYWSVLVLPGFFLSLASGLYQIFAKGVAFYMSQGWFHGKLTLLVILFLVTGLVGVSVRAAKAGELITVGKMRGLHITSGVLLISIVITTFVGRGY